MDRTRFAAVAVMMVVACAAVGPVAPRSARADLVGHWTFDDPTNINTLLADTSPAGSDNSGTQTAGTTAAGAAGVVGGAMELFGNQNINVGSSADFDTTTYTASAWLYADTTGGWRTAVGSWIGAGTWMHLGNDAGTTFGDHGGGQTSGGYVNTAQWYHVASVRNPGVENQLWINGVKVAQTSAGTPGIPGANNVYIGTKDGAGNDWDGKMDDLGIWNEALSPAQIKGIYLKGLLGADLASPAPPPQSPASGLVSYYRFEGDTKDTASAYTSSSSTVADDLTPRGGAANYEAGMVGQALRIGVQAGDTTDLYAPYSPDVDLPAAYAIEAWIKPSELTDPWQRLVLNWGGTEQSYHFAIRNEGGFPNAVSLFHEQFDGAHPNANGGTVVLDEWQYLVGVADGAFLRVYFNGLEVDAVPYDGTIQNITAEGLGVGDSESMLTGIKFNGLIDELAIWAVPLTPEQIASHYLAGREGYGLAEVPEPATAALVALAAAGLGAYARKRRATA